MRRSCLVLVTASIAGFAGCAYPEVGFEGAADTSDPSSDVADTTAGDGDDGGGGMDTGEQMDTGVSPDTTIRPDTTAPPDTKPPSDSKPPDTTVPLDTSVPPDTRPPDTSITLDTWVPPDTSIPVDTAVADGDAGDGGYGGVVCGVSTCGVFEQCCLTTSSGGSVHACTKMGGCSGAILTCDGPEDCPSTAKLCCMTVTLGSGTWPSCPGVPTDAACKSSCTPPLPFFCPGTGASVRCHHAADCTDTTAPYCCSLAGIPEGPICVGSLLKSYTTACY